MEILSCHEKLKYGLRSEEMATDAHYLLEYYRTLAGVKTPITPKMDTVFYDCRDIPFVYSIELDHTFPLIAYPYKLYRKISSSYH